MSYVDVDVEKMIESCEDDDGVSDIELVDTTKGDRVAIIEADRVPSAIKGLINTGNLDIEKITGNQMRFRLKIIHK